MSKLNIEKLKQISYFKQMNLSNYYENKDVIETLDIPSFNLLFLNVNEEIKKKIIDDKKLFDKIMQIPQTKHKKLIIELVSNDIKDYILRSENIKESIYAKKVILAYLNKIDYNQFYIFINKYNLTGNYFEIDINQELEKYKVSNNLKQLLKSNKQFNSLVFLKIKNKYELYIYIKFNILVEVKSNHGKNIYLNNNVFLDYDFLINVNKSHITKLIELLKNKNDNYNSTEIFVSAIKLYMIFGYDNSKKIIEDFYTYSTEKSLRKASYELYKDLRRGFRLNNQNKFYYYGIEKEILKSLKNKNYYIFEDICLTIEPNYVPNAIKRLTNKLSEVKSTTKKEQIIKEFVIDEIEKREEYYKEKDINKYYKYYKSEVRTQPLTVNEIYTIFSKINIKTKLNNKGQLIEDKELLKFLLGNFKRDNDCLLRLVLNKQALGLNNELYNIINNYYKIIEAVKSNKELSMYSLLDIIDISKVLLYNLKPDELDITLNTLSKILNSRKYMTENPKDIVQRVLDLHKLRKKKIYSTYPQIKGELNNAKFEVVSFQDESLLSAGIDGGDCLKVGAAGEDFLKYCLVSPNGGILYLYYNNEKYIIPFSKNGNMLNINNIDPRIYDENLATYLINILKEVGKTWINYPESEIEIVTITDIHMKEFMENMNLESIKFDKPIPLNTKIYTDYNKENVTNYIITKKFANNKINYNIDNKKFYQKRDIPYIYDKNHDEDKERIEIFINSIAYSSIEYDYNTKEEIDFYKENYNLLSIDNYFYITGSKDWFIAITFDYEIISYILPIDKRAVEEYEIALNYINENLPKLKKYQRNRKNM